MGRESTCKIEYDGRSHQGKALLETSEIIFRGDIRLKIPLKQITRVEAVDGKLLVTWPAGDATFHLGAAAAKWASKILNPPSRLDKLGIKSGTRIRWIGAPDDGFKQEAAQQGAAFIRTRPDVTFLRASTAGDLDTLKLATPPVWVVYPKGVKEIREIDVLNAGRSAGLMDIKVASFSPTHTALKFIQPRG